MSYSATLNDRNYIVERPDILVPAESARTSELFTFSDSGRRAGQLVRRGKGRVAVVTVPFEAVTSATDRAAMMKKILNALAND